MRVNFKLEDVKYTKITYLNSENSSVTVKATIKRLNEKDFWLTTKYDSAHDSINPQKVTISFVCSDGVYYTKTYLKKVESYEPYLLFILQVPDNIDYEQNRDYFRVNVEYDCICHVNDDNGYYSYNAKTRDVSASGVCLIFPTHVITSEKVKLELNIEENKLLLNAIPIRSELIQDNKQIISFRFASISDADRDYLSQICIKKQLEQKRNSLY